MRPLISTVLRLVRWEFWPSWVLYLPVVPVFLYHRLRWGSFAQFTAANRGLPRAGFVGYSKQEVLNLLPPRWVPQGALLRAPVDSSRVEAARVSLGLDYPLILKPDQGERGFGVTLITREEQVEPYLRAFGVDLILQQYQEGPLEVGILYERPPRTSQGMITSVVIKEPLHVVGNGVDSLEDLFWQEPRCRLHYRRLCQQWKSRRQEILPPGQSLILTDIGNHSRGFTFRDGRNLVTPVLTQLFDELCRTIEGFDFGRFDIRCHDWAALLRGEFMIVELNGLNAEPAHIYDPSGSLWRAWHTLFHQWQRIFRYAHQSILQGAKPCSDRELWTIVRRHLAQKQSLTKSPPPPSSGSSTD